MEHGTSKINIALTSSPAEYLRQLSLVKSEVENDGREVSQVSVVLNADPGEYLKEVSIYRSNIGEMV
ncbi:hypothetical protein ABXV18_27105 [Vibrio owensii]|uniref:hypothetical protein n=1 Tax=Vibrio owensii TaxID=696485 RepID=UPI0033948B26